MQMVIKGILAAFWLALIPAAAGMPFLKKKTNATVSESFLVGYLVLFSLAELLILPAIYLKLSLHVTAVVYGILCLAMAVWGAFCMYSRREKLLEQGKEGLRKPSLWLCLAIAAIFVQTIIVVYFAHFDADDAFYVGTASTAVHTDTLMSVNPYTGELYSRLPSRYVLSPFPVLLAVMSTLCGGLHPAIMAHVVYPAVFIPMIYLVLHQLGKKWFPEDKEGQGRFLLLCAVLTWFFGFTVYTSGNFGMVRIWQGKAVLCAVLLPFLFYLCLSITAEKEKEYSWLLLGMANLSCCHVSSMGIMLSPVMIGVWGVIGAWKYKSVKRLGKSILVCIPSLVLGVIYLTL